MATLLELQELFRNISDPEVEDLLRSGPPDTKWMVMDEKRRRGEMREAAKAMQSESQMKPRNMLEEYQANASSILGGQPPGDHRVGLSQDPGISSGQEDFMQSDMTQPFGNPDFYGDQSGDVPGYAAGGLALGAVGLGQLAWPFRHQIARTILPRSMYGRLFPNVVQESMRLPARAGAGTGRSLLTPEAAAVARTEGEAINASMRGVGRRQLGKAALKATPALGLGAAMLADGEGEQNPADALGQGRQVDPNAPQGTGQYLELLNRIMDRDDELRERIGDSRISTRDQIRRVGLRAFGAMASTPGGFGRGLGAAFDAASQELGAISAEESDMLRNAINEYQVGSRSVVDLISVIADINKSMQASGRGGMTLNGMVKLLEQYDFNDIPGVLAKARSLMGSELYAANQPQTDYDHSTLGSAYGTD